MTKKRTIAVSYNDSDLPIIRVDQEAKLGYEKKPDGTLLIRGNRKGLRLLERSLLGVAECERNDGFHNHLDDLYELNCDGLTFLIASSDT